MQPIYKRMKELEKRNKELTLKKIAQTPQFDEAAAQELDLVRRELEAGYELIELNRKELTQ